MLYEIVCNETGERYIGSTNKIYNRMRAHKCKSNNTSSKTITSRGNYTYKILETLENASKMDLLIKEKEYIETYDCINIKRPIRTKEEQVSEAIVRTILWRKNNKDKIIEYRKEHIMCDCGGKYGINNKARHVKSVIHINWVKNNI